MKHGQNYNVLTITEFPLFFRYYYSLLLWPSQTSLLPAKRWNQLSLLSGFVIDRRPFIYLNCLCIINHLILLEVWWLYKCLCKAEVECILGPRKSLRYAKPCRSCNILFVEILLTSLILHRKYLWLCITFGISSDLGQGNKYSDFPIWC